MLVSTFGKRARTRAEVPVELERQKSGLGLSGCLDAWTAIRRVPFLAKVDLSSRTVTAASLSDILRSCMISAASGWMPLSSAIRKRTPGSRR
jgi:hypothetical protein